MKADVLIASDGPRIKKERPTIFMGSRGVFNFTMKIKLRKGNYHSGNWGGLLANPGIILSHAISSLISVSGKINVAGLNPKKIPASVKNVLKKIKIIQNKNDPVININWGEKGLSSEEKVYAWNTLKFYHLKLETLKSQFMQFLIRGYCPLPYQICCPIRSQNFYKKN